MALTKDQIIQLDDRGSVEYTPAGWQGCILLRPFSSSQASDIAKEGKAVLQNMELLALSIVNEGGELMFKNADEVEVVFGPKNMATVKGIADKIMEINGFDKEAVEDLTKKSQATPTSGSSGD